MVIVVVEVAVPSMVPLFPPVWYWARTRSLPLRTKFPEPLLNTSRPMVQGTGTTELRLAGLLAKVMAPSAPALVYV